MNPEPSTKRDLMELLDRAHLPRHIAIIMDGNGRWAQSRRLPRIAGHREGINSVRETVTLCRELGISALTIYAFSIENWFRPREEIDELMLLLEEYLERELENLMKNAIRFRTIGETRRLPRSVVSWIEKVEKETAANGEMTLTIALSYGGRTEIVDAVRRVAEEVSRGRLAIADISSEIFSRYLYAPDLPEPDLLIRTSGEARISDFLLWQVAYTELYFTKTCWPDFRRRELLEALIDYQNRERRFGRVSDSGGKGPDSASDL